MMASSLLLAGDRLWTLKRRLALVFAGALAGLIAALAMLLLMAATRQWLGVSPPPEAVPDRLAPTLTISQFFDLFAQYGGYNGLKKFGVWTGIRAIVGAGVVFGVLYSVISESRWSREGKPGWFGTSRIGTIFIGISALIVWIGTVGLLWPVLGANYRWLAAVVSARAEHVRACGRVPGFRSRDHPGLPLHRSNRQF